MAHLETAKMSRRSLAVLIAIAFAWSAGCGTAERSASAPAAAAVPRAPDALTATGPLPEPAGKVLLRIGGVDPARAEGGTAAFDMAMLDRLPNVEQTVREPFLKRDVRFTGIRMDELLRFAGARETSERFLMHALDDFTVTLTRGDLASGGALLATHADGKPIPLAEGGPVRLVFHKPGKVASNTDNWIWSVDTMKAQRR